MSANGRERVHKSCYLASMASPHRLQASSRLVGMHCEQGGVEVGEGGPVDPSYTVARAKDILASPIVRGKRMDDHSVPDSTDGVTIR